jgi:small-conductance mechanosensitive channel
LLIQEAEPSTLSQTIIEKILYYLNYPFIKQDQFKVSIISLLLLALVITASAIISRYVRMILRKRVFPRFHIDLSLQYTLLKIIHYMILALGTIYGLKFGLALDLTSVAVVIGFLSVGIGFGLQYIAADIASGFILLFERPVRVGDYLKLTNVEGRVNSIGLRSTKIMTNDSVMVVVPNSALIRNEIVNWSYVDRVRIKIPIGVAYGSDTQRVAEALIAAGKSVEDVLDDPPPKVYFKAFGESSIDFELLVWIKKPHNNPQIRSDINYQIDRYFCQYQIAIPFPQRELHLHPDVLKMAQGEFDIDSVETPVTARPGNTDSVKHQ